MNWLKDLLETLRLRYPEPTPEEKLKSFTERENDLGIFTYSETGFTIAHPGLTKTLNWSDITQINVYKTDLLTTDRIDMEIVYGEWALTIHEELPGWYQFVLKTKEIFPNIPKDWDWEIVQPAFAANYRTIYTKNKP
jgi:hypothetical protein